MFVQLILAYVGYLTAGSTSNGSGGSTRRSRSRQTKTTRVSRSLSRSKVQKPAPVSTAYKTPANKRALPSNFGTITPKVQASIIYKWLENLTQYQF